MYLAAVPVVHNILFYAHNFYLICIFNQGFFSCSNEIYRLKILADKDKNLAMTEFIKRYNIFTQRTATLLKNIKS